MNILSLTMNGRKIPKKVTIKFHIFQKFARGINSKILLVFQKTWILKQIRAEMFGNTVQVHRAIKAQNTFAQNTFRSFGNCRKSTWPGFFSVSILCRIFALEFYKMKRGRKRIRLNAFTSIYACIVRGNWPPTPGLRRPPWNRKGGIWSKL